MVQRKTEALTGAKRGWSGRKRLAKCRANSYCNINVSNRSFENVAQFKYMGMTVRNQSLIHEGIMKRLNFPIACCHSIQNLLFSLLICKNKD
jgi:hypothetical protein